MAWIESVATRLVRLDRTTKTVIPSGHCIVPPTRQFEFAEAPFAIGASVGLCIGAEKFELEQGRRDGRTFDLGALGNRMTGF